uniref:Uncharacterized protein n=1 Tax=Opuntia streptacantha TaxID=393608 RepID=A0A7C9DBE6_OPUST
MRSSTATCCPYNCHHLRFSILFASSFAMEAKFSAPSLSSSVFLLSLSSFSCRSSSLSFACDAAAAAEVAAELSFLYLALISSTVRCLGFASEVAPSNNFFRSFFWSLISFSLL